MRMAPVQGAIPVFRPASLSVCQSLPGTRANPSCEPACQVVRQGGVRSTKIAPCADQVPSGICRRVCLFAGRDSLPRGGRNGCGCRRLRGCFDRRGGRGPGCRSLRSHDLGRFRFYDFNLGCFGLQRCFDRRNLCRCSLHRCNLDRCRLHRCNPDRRRLHCGNLCCCGLFGGGFRCQGIFGRDGFTGGRAPGRSGFGAVH